MTFAPTTKRLEHHLGHRALISAEVLRMLNSQAADLGYNRVIALDRLDVAEEGRHVIDALLVHHHRGGEPCEPHFRCMVSIETDSGKQVDAQLDVHAAVYTRLRETWEEQTQLT